MNYDDQALSYEDSCEHQLPPEEAQAWVAEMRAWTKAGRLQGTVLDIGAGTGLLTAVMKQAGLPVVGLELSPQMIKQGLRLNQSLEPSDFRLGHADEAGLFPAGSFDWIVSRQVLCHLTDPQSTFAIWHQWLKPNGSVMLVDGLWQASPASSLDPATQPFAFLKNAQPVAGALNAAGFTILRAEIFDELNAARTARCKNTTPRYVVVGRAKPRSC